MARPIVRSAKNGKITISPQPLDWFWWNLALWCTWNLHNSSAININRIWIFKIQDGCQPPSLKIKISRYHRCCLTDSGLNLQNDSSWLPRAHWPIKFQILKNQESGHLLCWKSIMCYIFASFDEIQHSDTFKLCLPCRLLKVKNYSNPRYWRVIVMKIWNCNIFQQTSLARKMTATRHFENWKNRRK